MNKIIVSCALVYYNRGLKKQLIKNKTGLSSLNTTNLKAELPVVKDSVERCYI